MLVTLQDHSTLCAYYGRSHRRRRKLDQSHQPRTLPEWFPERADRWFPPWAAAVWCLWRDGSRNLHKPDPGARRRAASAPASIRPWVSRVCKHPNQGFPLQEIGLLVVRCSRATAATSLSAACYSLSPPPASVSSVSRSPTRCASAAMKCGPTKRPPRPRSKGEEKRNHDQKNTAFIFMSSEIALGICKQKIIAILIFHFNGNLSIFLL